MKQQHADDNCGQAYHHAFWILSYVFDAGRGLTDVVMLDAQAFTDEPVATIRLPVRMPFGFHGGWAPDVDASSMIA